VADTLEALKSDADALKAAVDAERAASTASTPGRRGSPIGRLSSSHWAAAGGTAPTVRRRRTARHIKSVHKRFTRRATAGR
jgi:hypothetical protein